MPEPSKPNRRRMFFVAAAWLVAPSHAHPAPSRVLAYVDIDTEGARAAFARFQKILADRGVAERHGIEVRFVAVDQTDARAVSALPARLAAMSPWLVIATSLPTVEAVRATDMPLLFYSPADSITDQWVASFNRPGGRMTGYSGRLALPGKMIEALAEAVPARRRPCILVDRLYSDHLDHQEITAFARNLGLELAFRQVDTLDEFKALERSGFAGCDMLVVPYTTVPFRHGDYVIPAIASARLPAIYGSQRLAKLGGLMALEADISDVTAVFARQVEAIASGIRIGEIPVVRPLRYPLSVNLAAAKHLDVRLPASLLKRADVVF